MISRINKDITISNFCRVIPDLYPQSPPADLTGSVIIKKQYPITRIYGHSRLRGFRNPFLQAVERIIRGYGRWCAIEFQIRIQIPFWIYSLDNHDRAPKE